VQVNFRCWPTVRISTIYSFVTSNKPHRTTSLNGRNTTVRLPPPWRILAITWPKIMLRKNWSNQNRRQDPTPNMDERRGAAQRFGHLWASLPNMSCFLLITSSSTLVLMVIWLKMKNYQTIHHILVAHGERAWEWLVRWQSSMDWSSNTQNMPNQN